MIEFLMCQEVTDGVLAPLALSPKILLNMLQSEIGVLSIGVGALCARIEPAHQ